MKAPFKTCLRITWRMPFGQPGAWSPNDLPPELRKHYAMADDERIANYDPCHHLIGYGIPSRRVIDAITCHFNQYLHLRMPFGMKSWVWPSDQREPIRCPADEAIRHFHCHL